MSNYNVFLHQIYQFWGKHYDQNLLISLNELDIISFSFMSQLRSSIYYWTSDKIDSNALVIGSSKSLFTVGSTEGQFL